MGRLTSRILCVIIACISLMGEIHAQKKAVGSSFSYAGVGLVYEHSFDSKSFAEIQLRMETVPLYLRRVDGSGISASFSWNMIFADMESGKGNRVVFFAGPGVMGGMTKDLKSSRGFMLGLKGRMGGECTFSRNVTVSLSVSPVLGLHLGVRDGMPSMLLYKTGLLYTIMPEVGIKYAFK